MKKKGLRRLNTLVTAQTMGNLEKLADMAGYNTAGRVIDKLVRDHMVGLRNSTRTQRQKGDDPE